MLKNLFKFIHVLINTGVKITMSKSLFIWRILGVCCWLVDFVL